MTAKRPTGKARTSQLNSLVLNSLHDHIAVLDAKGKIIAGSRLS